MGKWMSRLETSKRPDDAPAKTTKTPEMRSDRVSVVSVAPLTGNSQKSGGLHVAVKAQPHEAERPTPAMHEAPPTPWSASVLEANGELIANYWTPLCAAATIGMMAQRRGRKWWLKYEPLPSITAKNYWSISRRGTGTPNEE